MSYTKIINFGPSVASSPNNNPLTYCMTTDLNNSFIHTAGEKYGPYSKPCQMFMSDYCANNWDGVCEYAASNNNQQYPNTVKQCIPGISGACIGTGIGNQFTQGEMLIRNTAAKKYLSKMSSSCLLRYQPFDPQVPTSPMISYWDRSESSGCASCTERHGACVPVYEVDPATIDSDPVMNKILAKPLIALDILLNIYNSAMRSGKLLGLQNTKLFRFFQTKGFQNYAKSSYNRAQATAGIKM